jgi:arylsulfatase A-like enzyme
VILVSIDTLRADRLNAYGHGTRRVSPHIDALARDGVLFESHISASPWTVPSHLTLFTSLSPSAHGVTTPFDQLKHDLGRERLADSLPQAVTTMAEVLAGRGFETAAFTGGSSLDPRLGFGQGFSRYDTSMFKLDARNMERLFDWVRARRGGGFFMFWHTFEVHAPYLRTTFLDEVLPPDRAERVRRATERLGSDLASAPAGAVVLGQHGAFQREVAEALYAGGIHSADGWFGRLTALLRELGLYDETLIVLTSDHGDEFADHFPGSIYNQHGHTVYEELVRVPLVVKLPGQRHAGVRVKAVTRAIDVLPTVLAALGVPAGGLSMEGAPLQPLWEGAGGSPVPPRLAFTEATAFSTEEKKAVRSDRHKYIVSVGRDSLARHGRAHVPEVPARRELYDLVADAGEKHDLLRSPSAEDERLAREMDEALRLLARARHGTAEKTKLDDATMERLRALGYVN